jgi:hypothetical protein
MPVADLKERAKAAVSRRDEIKESADSAVLSAAASGGQVTFQDRLRQFVQLEHLRRELEDLLDQCKREIETLDPVLREDFAASGMQRTTVDGLTVYVRTDRYVNKVADVTQTQVCEVLKAHGLSYLVSEGYNAQKLKSWVLDKLDEGGELPDSLSQLLKVCEVSRLATIRA